MADSTKTPVSAGSIVSIVANASFGAYVSIMANGLNQITPTSERAAKEAEVALAGLRSVRKSKLEKITLQADSEKVTIPREAFNLFIRILAEMANGNSITIVPITAELTTQQAADILNVSRPFLIGLLEAAKIPFRMVGTRRRIRFADLLEYQRKEQAEAKEMLDELAAEAEKHKLGY